MGASPRAACWRPRACSTGLGRPASLCCCRGSSLTPCLGPRAVQSNGVAAGRMAPRCPCRPLKLPEPGSGLLPGQPGRHSTGSTNSARREGRGRWNTNFLIAVSAVVAQDGGVQRPTLYHGGTVEKEAMALGDSARQLTGGRPPRVARHLRAIRRLTAIEDSNLAAVAIARSDPTAKALIREPTGRFCVWRGPRSDPLTPARARLSSTAPRGPCAGRPRAPAPGWSRRTGRSRPAGRPAPGWRAPWRPGPAPARSGGRRAPR